MTGDQTLLRQAQLAIKAGNTQEARRLLEQAARLSPNDYRPWLWLAGVTPSAQASLAYLERAAALDPQNPTIQRARLWAEQRLAQQPPPDSAVAPAAAAAPAAVAAPAAPVSPAASAAASRRRWLPAVVILMICLLGLAAGWAAWQRLPSDAPVAAAAVDTAGESPAEAVAAAGMTATIAADAPATAAATETAAAPAAGSTEPLPAPTGNETSAASPPTATTLPATATPDSHLPPKRVVAAASARATWTPTPTPSPTPSPTPVPTATPIPPTAVPAASIAGIPIGYGEPWVDVNLTTQTLVAYRGADPVFSTLISSGTWAFPTVTGQFRIYLRYESQDMNGYLLGYDYYLPDVPYVMYFYEDYALHGTYWHNNFGTPMSHGCVNLATGDAQWLFNFTSIGTLVNVHY